MTTKNQTGEPHLPRRTNVERSDTTRKKIIKSAIYCLRNYGYEGSSIYTVAEHAGISKGAAQHQYPNKADLMYAVAEYGLTQQAEYRARETAKIDTSDKYKWLASAAEITWKLAKKPYYVALIEISMATRNDKALKKRFFALNKKIDSLYETATVTTAAQLGLEPSDELFGLLQMHNTMLRGLAVGFIYSHDTRGLKNGFETLKRCQRLLLENAINHQVDIHAKTTKVNAFSAV